ncbi:hypothetical protein EO238_29420, partial [Citrobacter sp. AAK_AS5]
MADLVVRLARYARQHDPGFLVVANNPFAILDRPDVRDALSGVLSEDHLMRGERMVDGGSSELLRLREVSR